MGHHCRPLLDLRNEEVSSPHAQALLTEGIEEITEQPEDQNSSD